jgi:transposase-like protein
MQVSFKGAHFPQEIILMGVRWYGFCRKFRF